MAHNPWVFFNVLAHAGTNFPPWLSSAWWLGLSCQQDRAPASPLRWGPHWVLVVQQWQLLYLGHPHQVPRQGGGWYGWGWGEKAIALSAYWALVLTHVDTLNLPNSGYVIRNFQVGKQRLRNVALYYKRNYPLWNPACLTASLTPTL